MNRLIRAQGNVARVSDSLNEHAHTPHNERARIMQISIHFSFNLAAKLPCNARSVPDLNAVELELLLTEVWSCKDDYTFE